MSYREIQGDYSNFKGSVYHLRYAIRMLFAGEAERVYFYEGNDLLARPISPPRIVETSIFPTLFLSQQTQGHDVWVQLKFTEAHWTPTKLLSENLLYNFVANALKSERDNRSWEVRLVTPAFVDQGKILSGFIQTPRGNSELHSRLQSILGKLRQELPNEGFSVRELDENRIMTIGLKVLAQLSSTMPIRHETLVAEIEREIAFDYPDPIAVRRSVNLLLGSMLGELGADPSSSTVFDQAWLASTTGLSIGRRSRLASEPLSVCAEQVRRSLPRGWREDHFVQRSRLESSLSHFLESSATVFVVVGSPGAGKSWALSGWASNFLVGSARLLVRQAEILRYPSLEELVAKELREFGALNWDERIYLQRLTALSAAIQSPLIVILDELSFVPTSARDARIAIGNLVDQCRRIGAKLVIASQTSAWELHRLYDSIHQSEIFSSSDPMLTMTNSISPGAMSDDDDDKEEREELASEHSSRISRSESSRSFELGDYTDEELSQGISQQILAGRREEISLQLSGPAFLPLRNPYLLNLYIELENRRAPTHTWRPIPVDHLLDLRIADALDRVSISSGVDIDELTLALRSLSSILWDYRQNGGMHRNEIIDFFDAHLGSGIGSSLLAAMQSENILSTQSPYQFEQFPIRSRLFALQLKDRLASDTLDLADLVADLDSDVVIALLRSSDDPLPVALQLLIEKSHWLGAVCSGLSQCDPSDVRILALLTILARPDETGFIGEEACDALGYLAARSRVAWKWVARLYLSDSSFDRIFAERALSITANLVPRRVAATVLLRFQKTPRTRPTRDFDRRRYDRQLRGTLSPFLDMKDQTLASLSLQLIDRYGFLTGESDEEISRGFVQDFDEVRGMASLILGDDNLQMIIDELLSESVLIRYRAARSLKLVALERPALVAGPFIEAIKGESHPDVLAQLLWSAQGIVKEDAAALLAAIQGSKAANWSEAPRTAGLMLCLLSALVTPLPEDVFGFLPRDFSDYDPKVSALFSESLAFAWWRTAERIPEAKSVLLYLASTDVSDVPSEYSVFALRGKAIARLGLICIESVSSDELVGWQNAYSGFGLQFLFLFTDRFIRNNAIRIAEHHDINLLRESLIATIAAEARFQFDPLHQAHGNAAFQCANLCLEMIALLAAASEHPLAGLENLPKGRASAYLARRLLELGDKSESVVLFALEACSDHDPNSVTSASEEINRCRTLLAAIDPALIASQAKEPARAAFLDTGKAGLIASLGTSNPQLFLNALGEGIRVPGDLQKLHYLRSSTSTWPTQLIAEVYFRMFQTNRITIQEAKTLVTMMLVAVRALPDSEERRDYVSTYEAIAAFLANQPIKIPNVQALQTPIQRSHRQALAILRTKTNEGVSSTLERLARDRDSWLETQNFRIVGESTSFSKSTAYAFPATRLALIAVGSKHRIVDPAGSWITERMDTSDFLSEWNHALSPDAYWSEQQTQAYQAFREMEKSNPTDERFWSNYGLLALLQDELCNAEKHLERARSFTYASRSTLSAALYNLACVYARQDRDIDCERALIEWVSTKDDSTGHFSLETDEDFNNVRQKDWFKRFL